MVETTIAGDQYQVGKPNALIQFHISRRLGPFITTLMKAVGEIKNNLPADLPENVSLEDIAAKVDLLEIAGGPLMEVISEMPDDAVDYIIKKCLAVCRKKVGESWAVIITDNGRFMYELDMLTMLGLTVGVVMQFMPDLFRSGQQS